MTAAAALQAGIFDAIGLRNTNCRPPTMLRCPIRIPADTCGAPMRRSRTTARGSARGGAGRRSPARRSHERQPIVGMDGRWGDLSGRRRRRLRRGDGGRTAARRRDPAVAAGEHEADGPVRSGWRVQARVRNLRIRIGGRRPDVRPSREHRRLLRTRRTRPEGRHHGGHPDDGVSHPQGDSPQNALFAPPILGQLYPDVAARLSGGSPAATPSPSTSADPTAPTSVPPTRSTGPGR